MKKTVLLILLVMAAFAAHGQQIVPGMVGSDFWFSFLRQFGGQDNSCDIIIASEYDCSVSIEASPWLSPRWTTSFELEANVPRLVTVPRANLTTNYGGMAYPDTWHVVTTKPAVVYASNFATQSLDVSTILPTSALRCDYMTQTYGSTHLGQEVVVVAPYNDTQVQIVYKEAVYDVYGNLVYPPGHVETVMLDMGLSYHIYSAEAPMDGGAYPVGFDGTRIHSSKPVAVFQGHKCTYVPEDFSACDHLFEQALPLDCWGEHFVVMPTTGREKLVSPGWISYWVGDMVRVTAGEDNCIVTIEGEARDTLAAGETYEFFLANHEADGSTLGLDFFQSDALFVTTSTPAMVCFYITGVRFGGTPGDPASVVVPPVEQGVSHTITNIYNTPLTQSHFVNLVTSNEDAPYVTLDGQNIGSEFTATSDGYSWARLTLEPGVHIFDAEQGRFVATFYGLGADESYAYIAGTALRSADYQLNVHADRHSLCPGDTVTITASVEPDTLGMKWFLDGDSIGVGMDTVRLVLDSVGQHWVAVVVTPVGDTVWEIITVHPSHHHFREDSICFGDSLRWQGEWIRESGYYVDTLFSSEGCISVESLQFTVLGRPHPSFTVETDCAHYHYSVYGTVEGDTTGYSFSWMSSPPDATLEGQPWDSLGLSPSETTTYRFNLTGPCPTDTSFVLHPISWPVADMRVRPEVLSINHLDYEAYDQSSNATTRHWWVDGRFAGDEPVLHRRADIEADSLMLTLVAISEACTDTLRRVIPIVHTAVWLPNVFTPDGSTNNLFAPVMNESVAEELYIYNRQGLLVAHIVGENPSWDGTHDGTPCPQGAYVWRLHYHTDHEPLRQREQVGTVLLLR